MKRYWPVSATIAVLLISNTALAQSSQPVEMPRFETKENCDTIASAGGSRSERVFGTCFKREQAAYNALKPRWADVAPSIRAHCEKVTMVGGAGSFNTLKSCVDREEKSAAANTLRTFQR
ncbi:hypothetical protein [Rhodopila sp.]|jgi:hypothetical protein|uniref:hypothetical protein n=1 Tax=Rhodopila sp. TaxID=2480087 RepID=UPI002BBA6355|nr:hypothetical protein [Rhodopila sp.]HVZ07206.1 hypothetical protein [Rhodopila sp.]